MKNIQKILIAWYGIAFLLLLCTSCAYRKDVIRAKLEKDIEYLGTCKPDRHIRHLYKVTFSKNNKIHTIEVISFGPDDFKLFFTGDSILITQYGGYNIEKL